MHETYLKQAIALACENVDSGAGGPYGAVIVKDGVVIAASGNKVTQNLDPSAHAEIMAIRIACRHLGSFKLQGCTLYSSCEPCPMCLGAIYWARIEHVFFACNRFDAAKAGFDDSFIYEQIPLEPSIRSIPMLNIDMEEAETPFKLWNKATNKILY
ncbi:MAG: nucleoside deaminase [Methylomicrobium sp.]|nr:nucleoside deaminase [Methylomicrobium sp.]